MNVQQAGFYTASVTDYALAGIASLFASIAGGGLAAVISGFWLFEIFYAPAAGSAISEVIWRAIGKRRGRYIWMVGCAAFVIGSAIGAAILPLFTAIFFGRGMRFGEIIIAPLAALFNLGFLIYLPLAVGTLYTRLR